ncbi:MAG TPA: ketopantoate reductase family protein [Steroidobacteraceae bacterium]|nr:ketopantoate reductase family protein [Steroidobacteraceae bacterium]
MRALIVGAGSVGGYFGGRLAAAGRDVTFLVRPHRATQLARGLTLLSAGRETTIPIRLLLTGQQGGGFDVILLAVKAYQLEAALADFAACVEERTMILPVLNGMQHMETLRARFGAARVLGGVARIATSLDEQGRIVDQASFHDLSYGEWNGERSERIVALDALMRGAGFDARLSTDIEREMWEKWAMLASLGAITCLMDADVGRIARAPGGTDFVRRLFAEVVATVGAEWRPLADAFKSQVLALLTDRASSLTASMYRDMKSGHRIEADQIVGDLVRRAAAQGVATPLLSAVLARLKVYEETLRGQKGA